ncbi:MAG: hypothetical protein LJE94_08440 [Deltaproteobacteria bacterium]|nr:hypothetical protein [Deltaproteobacteria bacterium]
MIRSFFQGRKYAAAANGYTTDAATAKRAFADMTTGRLAIGICRLAGIIRGTKNIAATIAATSKISFTPDIVAPPQGQISLPLKTVRVVFKATYQFMAGLSIFTPTLQQPEGFRAKASRVKS